MFSLALVPGAPKSLYFLHTTANTTDSDVLGSDAVGGITSPDDCGDLDRRVVVGVSIALLSVIIIIIYRGARSVRPGIADAIVQHPEHGTVSAQTRSSVEAVGAVADAYGEPGDDLRVLLARCRELARVCIENAREVGVVTRWPETASVMTYATTGRPIAGSFARGIEGYTR